MTELLKLFLRFIACPISGGDDDIDGDDGKNQDAAEEQQEEVEEEPGSLEEVIEAVGDGDAGAEAEADRSKQEEHDRRVALEAENRALRESMQGRAAAPAGKTQEQLMWEQEDAKLRDEKTTDWERWAIDQARRTRRAEAISNHAMAQAQENADKSTFDMLAYDSNKTVQQGYKRFKEDVEKFRQEQIARGLPPAPRRVVLEHMIGKALLDGKLGKKAAGKTGKTSQQAESEEQRRAARGQSPGARGNVQRGGQGLSRLQSLEKKLADVPI